MALELIHTPRLSERTTLRLGGPALAEAVARTEADLDQLAAELPRLGGRPLALGSGSNMLATEGPLDLTLVRPANVQGPVAEHTAVGALVRVGAGYGLPRFLGLCQRMGLSGMEGLTGIPGRIGGAVAMNAGSYGVETGARLTRVRMWTPEGGLVWRQASQCTFGYRRFDAGVGKGFSLIWEAEFALTNDDPVAVRERMEQAYAKKRASQPVTAKSAGCVFKNPECDNAGRLLEQAGMRGKRLGGMAFSEKHANFLVNLGEGTPAQALELLDMGQRAVRLRSGVTLEMEVVVLK